VADHGCCADKACAPQTCMELPAGQTCGDCGRFGYCKAIVGMTAESTSCDWFPRRFLPRVQTLAEAREEMRRG